MRNVTILSMCILLCASAVFGQAGGIALFADPTYIDCSFIDAGAALVIIYAVHVGTPGAAGCQWMVAEGGGFNCTYISEIGCGGFNPIGDTRSGIACAYGSCLPSDILVATINYFCTGTSPACTWLEVVPDDDAPTGTIEIIDCSMQKLVGYGGRLYVNPDGSCDCWGRPWKVHQSSWGGVKVLYQ